MMICGVCSTRHYVSGLIGQHVTMNPTQFILFYFVTIIKNDNLSRYM